MSSTRLVFVIWGAGSMAVWATLSFMKSEMQAIPESVMVVLLTILTGKVTQRFVEGKEAPDKEPPHMSGDEPVPEPAPTEPEPEPIEPLPEENGVRVLRGIPVHRDNGD